MLLDLSHTCHTQARTGIQRVTRAVHATLAARGLAQPITWDPYAQHWRSLDPWENDQLTASGVSGKRGAHWPWPARWRGYWRRQRGGAAMVDAALAPAATSGLLVGELFSPAVGQALPALLAQTMGPRVALFHDAIALKFPELSSTKTVARFPAYLQELTQFDGIAAVSQDSRDTLVEYWRWLGVSTPPVVALPLGIDVPTPATDAPAPTGDPIILCVGTVEGRKNHLALLTACERLWLQGRHFQLHVIGLAQKETGATALATMEALQRAGHPLRYDGPVAEAALHQAYQACTFTVYPSLQEGFGLPVLESLAHGKPCICSAVGALGESAAGGGCLALPTMDATALASAVDRLLGSAAERADLSAAARRRTFRSWATYTDEFLAWMGTLPASHQ